MNKILLHRGKKNNTSFIILSITTGTIKEVIEKIRIRQIIHLIAHLIKKILLDKMEVQIHTILIASFLAQITIELSSSLQIQMKIGNNT